jgi:hypothetical protein
MNIQVPTYSLLAVFMINSISLYTQSSASVAGGIVESESRLEQNNGLL